MLLRLGVSFRRELCIVLVVIVILMSLPMLSVVALAGSGVPSASTALVSSDPKDHMVTITDPKGLNSIRLTVSTVWPVAGIVTLEFGASDPPYQSAHTGIDIADPDHKIGRPITTFMTGTVTKVVDYDNTYGHYIFIDHGNHIQSQYWHISKSLVRVGQHVEPGDIIALEGETGFATGPHLHFQIDVYGVPVNPRTFEMGDPSRS